MAKNVSDAAAKACKANLVNGAWYFGLRQTKDKKNYPSAVYEFINLVYDENDDVVPHFFVCPDCRFLFNIDLHASGNSTLRRHIHYKEFLAEQAKKQVDDDDDDEEVDMILPDFVRPQQKGDTNDSTAGSSAHPPARALKRSISEDIEDFADEIPAKLKITPPISKKKTIPIRGGRSVRGRGRSRARGGNRAPNQRNIATTSCQVVSPTSFNETEMVTVKTPEIRGVTGRSRGKPPKGGFRGRTPTNIDATAASLAEEKSPGQFVRSPLLPRRKRALKAKSEDVDRPSTPGQYVLAMNESAESNVKVLLDKEVADEVISPPAKKKSKRYVKGNEAKDDDEVILPPAKKKSKRGVEKNGADDDGKEAQPPAKQKYALRSQSRKK